MEFFDYIAFMEQQYFTPSIEDIRVGYEFQKNDAYNGKDSWLNYTFYKTTGKDMMNGSPYSAKCPPIDTIEYLIDHGHIRVPYLTKEQIEAEGWAYNDLYNCFNNTVIRTGAKAATLKMYKDNYIELSSYGDPLYAGECKDINTFRYICKLLGI
jgi:hypothetical protein